MLEEDSNFGARWHRDTSQKCLKPSATVLFRHATILEGSQLGAQPFTIILDFS